MKLSLSDLLRSSNHQVGQRVPHYQSRRDSSVHKFFSQALHCSLRLSKSGDRGVEFGVLFDNMKVSKMPSTQNAADILRPLSAQEDIYWKLSFTDQIHPVLAAHVAGVTTPDQWRVALDTLQARHPMLSVGIEGPIHDGSGPTQPFFRRHSQSQIVLRVVDASAGGRWEAEIERELTIPFQPGEAPLARAVLIHEHHHSIFILSVSHSISDGISLSFLIRDLLSTLAKQPLGALSFPHSAEDLLGFKPVAPATPPTDDLALCKTTNEAPSVVSLRLSQSFTEKLITTSREKGITVHGALAAALVLAMREKAPRFQEQPIRMISPVNVRSVLGVGQECGMYFTSPKTEFDPTHPFSFLEMARLVRQSIIDASTHEALHAVTNAMRGMTAAGLTKAAAAETLNQAFSIEVLLTNLGQTPYSPHFGGLTLESLWPAVLAGQEVQTVGATTTSGSLCLLLTSRKPISLLLETAVEILAKEIDSV